MSEKEALGGMSSGESVSIQGTHLQGMVAMRLGMRQRCLK